MKKVRLQAKKYEPRKIQQKKKINTFGLLEMMEGFLLEQNCRGNSVATITFYDDNIKKFINFLEAQGFALDTSSLTKVIIQKYILFLKTSKKWASLKHYKSDGLLSTKSIQTYLRAVKAWCAWQEEEGYIEVGLASGVKLPKASKTIIEILTEEEIQTLTKYH